MIRVREVWDRSSHTGVDKRPCSVQLTVFGDGEFHLRPTLIFRGEGLRQPRPQSEDGFTNQ